MRKNEKIDIVNKYITGVSGHEIAVIKEIFDKNAVMEDPVGSDALIGMEAICGLFEGAFTMGVKIEATGPVRCTGNAAAVTLLVVFEHMKIDAIDVFEFNKSGKIVSMKAYWGPENIRDG